MSSTEHKSYALNDFSGGYFENHGYSSKNQNREQELKYNLFQNRFSPLSQKHKAIQ